MNQSNPINGDPNDKRLDQLLTEGSLELNDRSRLERLDTFWLNVTARRVRNQRAAAGAILLSVMVVTVSVLQLSHESNGIRLDQKRADSPDSVPQADPVKVANNDADIDVESNFQTAPVFHQLVLNAGNRHFSERRQRQRARMEAQDIHELLSIFVAEDPELDRSEILQKLRTEYSDPEWTLIQFVRAGDLTTAQQRLALACLTAVAGHRSIPMFLDFYRRNEFVDIVAPAIANRVSADQVFQLAMTATSNETRCLFAAALLKGDSRRLSLFLTLVEQSHTSQLALECLAEMTEPPTTQLFQFLSSSKRRLRLTAALALGQIDDDNAVRRLMQMAQELPTQFPAMVALASSDNETAKQFVQHARFDIQLADSVQSAQSLLHSVSQNFTEKG